MLDRFATFDPVADPTTESSAASDAPIAAGARKSDKRKQSAEGSYPGRWTRADLRRLLELGHNPDLTTADLAAAFPGRKPSGIRRKLGQLMNRGKVEWTADQKKQLLALAESGLNYDQIAAEVSKGDNAVERSAEACRYKLRSLGFKKAPKSTDWTKEQEDLLRLHYHSMTKEDLAKLLDREVHALYVKACRLGLTAKRDCASKEPTIKIAAEVDTFWTPKNIDRLRWCATLGLSAYGIRKRLKRPASCIEAAAVAFGIEIRSAKTFDTDMQQQLRDLAAQGVSRREARRILDVSMSSLERWVRRLGLSFVKDRSCYHPRLKRAAAEKTKPLPTDTGVYRTPVYLPSAPPPKTPPKPTFSRTQEVDAIATWLATNQPKRPSYSIVDQACNVLRRNGDSIIRLTTGIMFNGSTISPTDLIARANKVLARKDLPPLLQAVENTPAETLPAPVTQSPGKQSPSSAPMLFLHRAAAAPAA